MNPGNKTHTRGYCRFWYALCLTVFFLTRLTITARAEVIRDIFVSDDIIVINYMQPQEDSVNTDDPDAAKEDPDPAWETVSYQPEEEAPAPGPSSGRAPASTHSEDRHDDAGGETPAPVTLPAAPSKKIPNVTITASMDLSRNVLLAATVSGCEDDVAEAEEVQSPKEDITVDYPERKVWESGAPDILFDPFHLADDGEAVDAEEVMELQEGLTGLIYIKRSLFRPDEAPMQLLVISGEVTLERVPSEESDGLYAFRFLVNTPGLNRFAIRIGGQLVFSPKILIRETEEDTEPVITVEGDISPEGDSIMVDAVVSGKDPTDTQDITVTLSGENGISRELEVTMTPAGEGVRVRPEAIDFTNDEAGVYTVTVAAVDTKGNRVQEEISYILDEEGSVFLLDEMTSRLMKQYYTNTPPVLMLTQETAGQIEETTISVSFNGSVRKLAAGEDYDVHTTFGNPLNRYEYVIFPENFREDGYYSVSLITTDELSRTETSRAGASLDFMLDRVVPVLVTTDLASGGIYYGEKYTVTFAVSDDVAVEKAVLRIDDDAEATFTSDAIRAMDEQIPITLNADDAPHDIRITLYDRAGNAAEAVYEQVLVTADKEKALTLNDIGTRGLIILIAATAVIMLFTSVILRKKGENG